MKLQKTNEEKQQRLFLICGVVASIFIHCLILVLGFFWVGKSAQYAMQAGFGSTTVELVAGGPKASAVAPEKPKTSQVAPKPFKPLSADDVSELKAKKEKSAPQPEPKPPNSSVAAGNAVAAAQGSGGSAQGGGGNVSARPDYLHNPPPEYPEEARLAHQEGVTVLKVEVSEEGRALSVILQKSSGYRKLDESALSAVKNWKFKPATELGIAMSSSVLVPVRFTLREGR